MANVYPSDQRTEKPVAYLMYRSGSRWHGMSKSLIADRHRLHRDHCRETYTVPDVDIDLCSHRHRSRSQVDAPKIDHSATYQQIQFDSPHHGVMKPVLVDVLEATSLEMSFHLSSHGCHVGLDTFPSRKTHGQGCRQDLGCTHLGRKCHLRPMNLMPVCAAREFQSSSPPKGHGHRLGKQRYSAA